MDRDLKKCYKDLELPLTATENDVVDRRNNLIKDLKSKEKETKISTKEEIAKIENLSDLIINHIKNNGTGKDVHRFESSFESILGLFIVLLIVVLLFGYSLYVLL